MVKINESSFNRIINLVMKSIGIMRILQKMFQNYLPSKQFNKYISFNICYNKSTISFPNHFFYYEQTSSAENIKKRKDNYKCKNY